MRQTSLEYYHETTLLTRLLNHLVTAVNGKKDKLQLTPVAEPRRSDRPECGGYNEAFIIHHWASFTPRN